MFARALTTQPLRRSLELQRTWARSLHNGSVNSAFLGVSPHVSNSTQPPLVSDKPIFSNHQRARITEDVDVMMERIFGRAIPVPHAGVAVGENSLDDILHTFQTSILDPSVSKEELLVLNRNARRPNKANKGARPCSRASRRKKKEKIGKRGR